MNRKACYADALRLTRWPRRWRSRMRFRGIATFRLVSGGRTITGAFRRVPRSRPGHFESVGSVTETWETEPPKLDFSSFQIDPGPPPSDQFCTDEPFANDPPMLVCTVTGYLKKMQ